MALSEFSDSSIISFPAKNARTSASPSGKYFTTAFISIASDTTRPLKPSESFKTPVTIGRDNVEGKFFVESNAGISIWAIITPLMPALIACLKGYSSSVSSRFLLKGNKGRSRCESTLVSPWPGKCLAVVKARHPACPSYRQCLWQPHCICYRRMSGN